MNGDSRLAQQPPYLAVLAGNAFLASFSCSVLEPSFWLYFPREQSTSLNSPWPLVPCGEVLGAMICLAFSKVASTRTSLLCWVSAGTAANLGLLLASLCGVLLNEALLASAVLLGVWSGGQQAMALEYINEVAPTREKMYALTAVSVSGCFGRLLGPGIGLLLGSGILLPSVLTVFAAAAIWEAAAFCELPKSQRHCINPRWLPAKQRGLVLCCFLCVALRLSAAVSDSAVKPQLAYEVRSSQVVYLHFAWSEADIALLLVLAIAVSAVALTVLRLVEGQEVRLVATALALATVGWLFLFDYRSGSAPFTWFVLGYTCVAVFSEPLGYTAVLYLASRALGPTSAVLSTQQPFASGLVIACSLVRLLSPYCAFALLVVSPQLCYGAVATLTASAFLAQWKWPVLPHPHTYSSDFISFDDEDQLLQKLTNPTPQDTLSR